MIKKITRIAKLEFLAGQARPGPELAGLGIIMPEFIKQFNDATKDRGDEPVPVTITVYKNKSFDFKTHTSPTSYMLKKVAKIKSGSANAKTTKVATITKEQLIEIAKYKIPDLNTDSLESIMKTIAGTARNMGILIKGIDNIKEEKAKADAAAKAEVAAKAREEALLAAEQATTEEKEIKVETTKQKTNEEVSKTNEGEK